MLRLPVVPEIFGFDPRLQFVHENDVTGALAYATLQDVPGVFNVAGEGTMPWSEVCTMVGKRRVALPPILSGLAAEPLRVAGLVDIPPEVLALLRYGRGVDTSAYREAGFRYEYTTAGAVDAFTRGVAAPDHGGPPRVPLRARRGELLPALPGGRARRHLRWACTSSVVTGSSC